MEGIARLHVGFPASQENGKMSQSGKMQIGDSVCTSSVSTQLHILHLMVYHDGIPTGKICSFFLARPTLTTTS